MVGMATDSSILSPSPAGRLAPKPFIWAAMGVYAAGFLSQLLLNTPVTSRAGIVPFALAQIVLGWCWFVLHVRRLRDSGRGPGWAIALTALYTVPVVLLFGMILTAHNNTIPETSGFAVVGVLGVLVFLLLWSLVVGPQAALGTGGYGLVANLLAIMLAVLIAFAFTIWLANRPRVPPPAPP
jgi:uncharacterized membrane protein YhaH (DUF805 family)